MDEIFGGRIKPSFSRSNLEGFQSAAEGVGAQLEGMQQYAPAESQDKFTFTVYLIMAIVSIVSIIIAVIDIAIDIGDAAADAATFGAAGLGTSIIDIISEIILEILQALLYIGFAIYLNQLNISTFVAIFIGLIPAVIDIIMSVVGFVPYVDIAETVIEIIGEIIQFGSLLYIIITYFM